MFQEDVATRNGHSASSVFAPAETATGTALWPIREDVFAGESGGYEGEQFEFGASSMESFASTGLEYAHEDQPMPVDLAARIASIAETENRRWTLPTGKKLWETEPAARPIIREYWEATRATEKEIGYAMDKNVAWSAAFVSWVMKSAGVPGFLPAVGHWSYVVKAKRDQEHARQTAPYWAYPMEAVAPQVGDLIVRSRVDPKRPGVTTWANVEHGLGTGGKLGRALHCDIVTAVHRGSIRVVGGNVGAPGSGPNGVTVNARTLTTDPDGKIVPQRGVFAVMRLRAGQAMSLNPVQPAGVQPRPVPVVAPIPAAGSVKAGQIVVDRLPMLSSHAGSQPDLVLKWNDMDRSAAVDVVVHFHGHAILARPGTAKSMNIVHDMLPHSGLDFADPANRSRMGRTSPTLMILPRGHHNPGWRTNKQGKRYWYDASYVFPALTSPGALQRLIDESLARFSTVAGSPVRVGRLILTAHSGGGAALMKILGHTAPDEVHVFDALYADPQPLIDWALKYHSSGNRALRVIWADTTANSKQVQRALAGIASSRFRVEQATVGHMAIPSTYGWMLLKDPAANFDRTTATNEFAGEGALENMFQESATFEDINFEDVNFEDTSFEDSVFESAPFAETAYEDLSFEDSVFETASEGPYEDSGLESAFEGSTFESAYEDGSFEDSASELTGYELAGYELAGYELTGYEDVASQSAYEDSGLESVFEDAALESSYEDRNYEGAAFEDSLGTEAAFEAGYELLPESAFEAPYEFSGEFGFETTGLESSAAECECREHAYESAWHEERPRPVPAQVQAFVRTYGSHAAASQATTGVPALVTLGQAALESGWGKKAPGNNFFGIKARATDPESSRQLLTTREVLSRPDGRFPEVISVTPRPDGRYNYVVKDWFRRYPSATEGFAAHGVFLRNNRRYTGAFATADPYEFARAVAAAGYATAPDYYAQLSSVMRLIERAGVTAGGPSAPAVTPGPAPAPAKPAPSSTQSAPTMPTPGPPSGGVSATAGGIAIPPLPLPVPQCLTGSDAPLDRALRTPGPANTPYEGISEIATFATQLARLHAQRAGGDARFIAEREAWLVKDYAATMQAGLARYGAGWRKRMQSSVVRRRAQLQRARRGALTAQDRLALEAERCGQEAWWLSQLNWLRKGWMVGRREQVDYKTLMPRHRGLGAFNPPPVSAALVPIEPLGDGRTPIAPETRAFLAELRRRLGSTFGASNYAGHGGGSFRNRGYSLDLFLPGQHDARGFYPSDKAVAFLMHVGEAAAAVGLRWRVLYNDFAAAAEVNRRTGTHNVLYMGDSSKGLNWHGPLILHFHLDLAP